MIPAGLNWAAAAALPESIWPYILLGLFVGLMVGLTSHGAGAISTPALILVLDVPSLTAVSTSIVVGGLTKALGSWTHHQYNNVDWKLVRRLLEGSLPAATLAVFGLHWLQQNDAEFWVNRFLGAALVVLGLCVLARDTGWVKRLQGPEDDPHRRLRAIVIGAVVGLVFGATSVGTGSLLVVLLSMFLPLEEKRVVGTAILYGFALSVYTSVLHIFFGNVSWPVAGWLLLGTLPGVWLGVELANRAPRRLLRAAFSVAVVVAGWKLI